MASCGMSEFVWPVRVYYEDTDSGGVVYYANYLKFMERARTEFLRVHGFEQTDLVRDHGVIFVVRDVHISYLRPAVFNDLLNVTVSVHAAGRSWIEFSQTVVRDELLSRAQVKIVCVNHLSFKPVEIPEIIRNKMELSS
jgi:acyl-CoA thioester hydrolase